MRALSSFYFDLPLVTPKLDAHELLASVPSAHSSCFQWECRVRQHQCNCTLTNHRVVSINTQHAELCAFRKGEMLTKNI